MNLTLARTVLTETATLGELYINGIFFCYTLEDKVRDKGKVYGQTAIPYGTYEIELTLSNRFKRILPLLHKVPGFSGIRIHSGNHSGNTEGCILVGFSKISNTYISASKQAELELVNKMQDSKNKIKIDIVKHIQSDERKTNV